MFDIHVKMVRQDVPVSAHFNGQCLQCKSMDTKIRSSYTREVTDLGTPIEQRIARVTMATIECNACGCTFTPVPREYPLKYEYSLAVITWAMARYYHENASANTIQKGLKMLHNVDVPVDTIYTWIKRLSDEYAKTMLPEKNAPLASNTEPPAKQEPRQEDNVKTIAVDGTFVTTGVDVIGKKKPVVLLSLTRRPDGTLLPTSKKPRTKKK